MEALAPLSETRENPLKRLLRPVGLREALNVGWLRREDYIGFGDSLRTYISSSTGEGSAHVALGRLIGVSVDTSFFPHVINGSKRNLNSPEGLVEYTNEYPHMGANRLFLMSRTSDEDSPGRKFSGAVGLAFYNEDGQLMLNHTGFNSVESARAYLFNPNSPPDSKAKHLNGIIEGICKSRGWTRSDDLKYYGLDAKTRLSRKLKRLGEELGLMPVYFLRVTRPENPEEETDLIRKHIGELREKYRS